MTVRLLVGDWIDRLRTLRDQSVQCVVTSPPYWGLRDYGTLGQLGLEADPREYIEKVIVGFREVRRVLRNDGTLWLNMGDSYTDGGRGDDAGSTLLGGRRNQLESRTSLVRQSIKPFGLGRKQLVGMPWRVAFALQDDGWILRSDVIWSKPNPMPESVNDRPTRAHEYLFLFSKRARYFYDAKAIAEAVTGGSHSRGAAGRYIARLAVGGSPGQAKPNTRSRMKGKQNESFSAAVTQLVTEKNKRSVWSIVPKPFKGAHFATFPPALVEPCIMAGTSLRACELCGAAWRPVYRAGIAENWKSTCDCSLAHGTGRCVVLDPFGGAGTTSLVANRLGCDSILIEISQDYANMTSTRLDLPLSEAAAD